jgi:hypothetical protein
MNGQNYIWRTQNPLQLVEPDNTDLAKSKGTDSNKKGWVGGFISVEVPDAEGDIIYAKGMDTSDFLKSGYFVYEHPSLAHMIVGRPTSTDVREHPCGAPGVFCRGYFYLLDPMGKQLYEKALVLEQSEEDENRRLAWSVEGKGTKIAKREGVSKGLHIYESRPHTAAVTHRPVNFYARFRPELHDIAASLSYAEEKGQLIETLEAILENRKFMKSMVGFGKNEDDARERHIQSVISRFKVDRETARRVTDRVYNLLLVNQG